MKMTFIAMFFLATGGQQARGQTISYGKDAVGLEISAATLSSDTLSVQVVFRNATAKPVTGYVIRVVSAYSNGEQLSWESFIDFFESLGFEGQDSPGEPWGALAPGGSRTLTTSYSRASEPGASLVGLQVSFTGAVFDDETTAGKSAKLGDIFHKRDTQSGEILRWCADLSKLSSNPITQRTLSGFIDSHMADAASVRSSSGSLGLATANDMASVLRQGGQFGADGSGSLSPFISAYLDARCSAARQHVNRKDTK